MVPCNCAVWRKRSTEGQIRPMINGLPAPPEAYWEQRPCGAKAEYHFEVTYGEPLPRFEHDRPSRDTFSLCQKHGEEYKAQGLSRWGPQPAPAKVQSWKTTNSSVSGQRGYITAVMEIEAPKEDRKNLRKIEQFKGMIRRMMRQENAKTLTSADWEVVFGESLHEYIIESVLES